MLESLSMALRMLPTAAIRAVPQDSPDPSYACFNRMDKCADTFKNKLKTLAAG